ncbi:MAG: hypothetical protein ACE5GS_05845 [Kiloniellaceae bacterium]
MLATKAFWKSRGFWGPLVAFAAFASQQAGAGEIDAGKTVDFILTLIEGGGLFLGWLGRIRATAPLGLSDRRKVSEAAWPATVLAVLLAVLVAGCAATRGDTPAQRLYGVKADYQAALELAVAYKRDCAARPAELRGGCAAHVAEIRRIDLELIQPALARAERARAAGDDPALAAAADALLAAVRALTLYMIDNGIGAPAAAAGRLTAEYAL